jgi:hypothetical protein
VNTSKAAMVNARIGARAPLQRITSPLQRFMSSAISTWVLGGV